MIAQLTGHERRLGILICLAVALAGLLFVIAGRNDPIGLHGALMFVAAVRWRSAAGRSPAHSAAVRRGPSGASRTRMSTTAARGG